TRPLEHLDDIGLPRAVEDRARDRNSAGEAAGEISQIACLQRLDLAVLPTLVHLVKETAKLPVGGTALDVSEHFADASAEPGRGPAEMGLEDLAHIHSARHAERVQYDIDRRTVVEVRHVLA